MIGILVAAALGMSAVSVLVRSRTLRAGLGAVTVLCCVFGQAVYFYMTGFTNMTVSLCSMGISGLLLYLLYVLLVTVKSMAEEGSGTRAQRGRRSEGYGQRQAAAVEKREAGARAEAAEARERRRSRKEAPKRVVRRKKAETGEPARGAGEMEVLRVLVKEKAYEAAVRKVFQILKKSEVTDEEKKQLRMVLLMLKERLG